MMIVCSLKQAAIRRVPLVVACTSGWMLIAMVGDALAVTPSTQRACRSDYKRLCPSYKHGSSELRYCMESQRHSISHNCVRTAADNGDISRSQARSLGVR